MVDRLATAGLGGEPGGAAVAGNGETDFPGVFVEFVDAEGRIPFFGAGGEDQVEAFGNRGRVCFDRSVVDGAPIAIEVKLLPVITILAPGNTAEGILCPSISRATTLQVPCSWISLIICRS